jgi:hypothetical protein
MAKDIYAALLELQEKDIENITKNAKNPHFKNTYITLNKLLEVVRPVLTSKGVLLTQTPTTTSTGEPGLWTSLTHLESGTSIDGKVPLMLEKDNPQGLGSAITYLRRYALMSMLGLVADEDDDAQAASPVRAVVNPGSRVEMDDQANVVVTTKPLF